MSDSFNTLLIDKDEQGVTTVTINRPDKLNALNEELLNELAHLIRKVNIDNSIKGCIIKGAGDKAFVAGADINELIALDENAGRMKAQKGQQIFQAVEDTRKPIIALINGYALGGGAELAMACHLRLAGETAVFGFPEVGLGLIPGYGGTQRLPKIVGRSKALEIILTAEQISAKEALQVGLVNRLVPKGKGMEEARKLMNKILKNGPLAIQNALRAIYHSGDKNGFQIEAELFGLLCNTKDVKEGTSAFLEKRKPKFKGE